MNSIEWAFWGSFSLFVLLGTPWIKPAVVRAGASHKNAWIAALMACLLVGAPLAVGVARLFGWISGPGRE